MTPTPDASWPPQAVAAFFHRLDLIDAAQAILFGLAVIGFALIVLAAGTFIVTGLRR